MSLVVIALVSLRQCHGQLRNSIRNALTVQLVAGQLAALVRRSRSPLPGPGRPVFVDFTASWCLSCQVNERVAFEQP